MTGAIASIVRDHGSRARADAWLTLALFALVFVPLPALLFGVAGGSSAIRPSEVVAELSALVSATPLFAAPLFVLGGGIGTLVHLVLTAPERFAALERGRDAPLARRSMVASSLFVGAMFAAAGLVMAIAVFGIG